LALRTLRSGENANPYSGTGEDEIFDPERVQPFSQRASSSSELNETALVGVSPLMECTLPYGTAQQGLEGRHRLPLKDGRGADACGPESTTGRGRIMDSKARWPLYASWVVLVLLGIKRS